MTKENILIIVLGLAAVATIITEVSMSAGQLSQTESALFGALQFLFSLAFAWYLSKESSQAEFDKRQRKFAVSAFRRIKEIEVQISHLLKRLDQAKRGDEAEHYHGLDVASVMAQSINKTTQSSKLDWADVIGDEIESLEKIENLQDIEVTDETQESEDGDSSTSKLSEKIEELKSSLSSELKLYASERMRPKAKNVLRQSIERLGFVA